MENTYRSICMFDAVVCWDGKDSVLFGAAGALLRVSGNRYRIYGVSGTGESHLSIVVEDGGSSFKTRRLGEKKTFVELPPKLEFSWKFIVETRWQIIENGRRSLKDSQKLRSIKEESDGNPNESEDSVGDAQEAREDRYFNRQRPPLGRRKAPPKRDREESDDSILEVSKPKKQKVSSDEDLTVAPPSSTSAPSLVATPQRQSLLDIVKNAGSVDKLVLHSIVSVNNTIEMQGFKVKGKHD